MAPIRLLIAFLAVPLTAFTCFPSPISTVMIDSHDQSKQASTFAQTASGELVLSSIRAFAQKFSLHEYDCQDVWPASGNGAPCIGFSRFGEEGIGIYLVARPREQQWHVLLMKERRVFGNYSLFEVQRSFDTLVGQPIAEALGHDRVHLH